MEKVLLSDLVMKKSSSIKMGDLSSHGNYPVFGASGIVGFNDSFQTSVESIALIKDGAGVGRAQRIPAFSSVIGTMQLLVPKDGNDVGYLYHLFRFLDLGHAFSGTTIPHIYFKDYCRVKVKKNCLQDQLRIADSLNGVCALIESAKFRVSELDELVKSRFIEGKAIV